MNSIAFVALVLVMWLAVAPDGFGRKWGETFALFSVGYDRGWASVMEASDE